MPYNYSDSEEYGNMGSLRVNEYIINDTVYLPTKLLKLLYPLIEIK